MHLRQNLVWCFFNIAQWLNSWKKMVDLVVVILNLPQSLTAATETMALLELHSKWKLWIFSFFFFFFFILLSDLPLSALISPSMFYMIGGFWLWWESFVLTIVIKLRAFGIHLGALSATGMSAVICLSRLHYSRVLFWLAGMESYE